MKTKTKLQAARERMGLSQREFAAACGVKRGVIQLWESHRAIPRTDHAILIAEFAGLDMEDLFADFEIQRQPRGEGKVIA